MNITNLYKRNIKTNYIFTTLFSLDLTRGLWMIYLFSKGMSLTQLGILEGVFHINSFLMETPTGAIADIFGRKTSRLIGRVLQGVYIIILLLGTNFFHYILAFIVCSLSYNLESGAAEALVYDSLLETKDEDKYLKVNGYIEAIIQSVTGVALLVGGYLAVKSHEMVFMIQLVIIAFTIVSGMYFKETTIGREVKHREQIGIFASIKKQYVDSLAVLRGNSRLLYLIFMLSSLSAFTATSFFYLQVHYKLNGLDEFQIGIFLALAGIAGTIGGLSANKLESIFKEKGLIRILPVIMAIGLWGLANVKLGIASYILIGMIDSILYVVFIDYINKIIPSDSRATVISFSSMMYSIIMILIFPLLGAFGDVFGMGNAFIALAIISTIFAITNLVLLSKNDEKKRKEEKNA